MRILQAHNQYQTPGGEDRVAETERNLLVSNGHEVVVHTVHNRRIPNMNRLELATKTLWNPDSYDTVRRLIEIHAPDVLHVHNTFPLLSPSIYYAARSQGVPVVQTLHNFRIFCANGLFFRDGHVCTDCLGRVGPLPGIVHACYRDSHSASLGVAALQTVHRLLGTWRTAIARYVALTPSARDTMVDAGLPADRVALKPNFLPDDTPVGSGTGGYALFVGRFSREKGIDVLLDAWPAVSDRLPLVMVGDGPRMPEVRAAAASQDIEVTGWLPPDDVVDRIGQAHMLIFPSLWQENCPMTLLESLASGTPVLASNLGAMRDLIRHDVTGRLFAPGRPEALVHQVQWALDNPDVWKHMRHDARRIFEERYSASVNYAQLLDIYRSVLPHSEQPASPLDAARTSSNGSPPPDASSAVFSSP